MNILFFLTPKSEVAYVYNDQTLEQVMDIMEKYKYAAIPMINRKGGYVGTITDGDILWAVRNKKNANIKEAENIIISCIARNKDNTPVSVNADIEDLLMKSMNQNFIPVIDDTDTFIGIVTRKDILQYCYSKLVQKYKKNS